MFRDPSFFRDVPRARSCRCSRTYPSLKIWVAGCSTGEEALLVRDPAARRRPARAHACIYATDINPEALRKAEAGIYPIERVARLHRKPPRGGRQGLALGLLHGGATTSALFDRTLRKHVVFSDHSLATDSVFAEVQLVSCRNVLIYFDRALQDRALGLFERLAVPPRLPRPGLKETLAVLARTRQRFRELVRRRALVPECCEAMRPAGIEAIVIGGSAGALEALRRSCRRCRRRCPCRSRRRSPAARTGAASCPSVFAPRCALPVREPRTSSRSRPGTICFAPPDYHLLVERDRTFALSLDDAGHFSRPVDRRAVRVRSRRLRQRACVGVVLSGANEDGARGLAAIARRGRPRVVQAPDERESWRDAARPRSAPAPACTSRSPSPSSHGPRVG